ncbi:MAG: hypothetical protein P1V20_15830 [Verrucomicrobiales bacterium]|nr:hypothetical protein [Verrucomicrobiales bacterium]
MISLLMITNDPVTAKEAVACGVNRIFVDLEQLGKKERQSGRDTWMSHHSLADVSNIRAVIPEHELLVRVDPLNQFSAGEIDEVISRGADFIMLPMFRSVDEVSRVRDLIDGRVGFIPLVETVSAMDVSGKVAGMAGVTELYLGLNDLHLDRKQTFMFEPLVDGSVERFSDMCRSNEMPFGFGGIARMSEGSIPGKLVLSEHVRMGSSRVILSRTFQREEGGEDWGIFAQEVQRLREEEARLEGTTSDTLEGNRKEIELRVSDQVAKMKAELSS